QPSLLPTSIHVMHMGSYQFKGSNEHIAMVQYDQ
ncbi:hypothetical protein HaLaN_18887, partial [Haematococcus lacustris]